MELPLIYCINLPSSRERRERMLKRFKLHQLRFKFVEGVDQTSGLIEYYGKGKKIVNNDVSMIATYAAHLKAIRMFVEDGAETAIICEDDIKFHRHFREKFQEKVATVGEIPNLITLSFMMTSFQGTRHYNDHFVQITRHTWGAQIYLLTRAYALEILHKYDRCYQHLKIYAPQLRFTPEGFIQESNGLRIIYPLAIEESIDSDRGDTAALSYHIKHFSYWGYENYPDSFEMTSTNSTEEETPKD